MDSRFVRSYENLTKRRQAGEPLGRVLRSASTRDLIAALAGCQNREPVLANAIATELLNRKNREPFLGALLVSLTMLVATFVVDTLLTGTPFFELSASSERGYVLAGLAAGLAVVSALMYGSWRGRFPAMGRILHRWRDRRRGKPLR